MTHYTLTLPLYVGGEPMARPTAKKKTKKKYWLNLNNYRNWPFIQSNSVKKKFKEAVKKQVETLPNLTDKFGTVVLQYRFYPPTNARRDLGNAFSVIDKFFADALVELGKLEDDDTKNIIAFSCIAMPTDKDNPRMEVKILPGSSIE